MEIDRKPLFWVKNVTSEKEAKNYSESYFSKQVGKGSNPEEYFDLMKHYFGQSSEMEQIFPPKKPFLSSK